MWKKLSPKLQFILGWPLSIIALLFITKTIGPSIKEVQSSLSHIQPLLLVLGVLCFIGYYYLRGIIWHKLLTRLSYEIPVKNSLFLWAISEIKRYIPGNIWSFLGHTVLFERYQVKKRDTAYAIFIEGQLVLIASVVVSLLSLSFVIDQILPIRLPFWTDPVIVLSVIVGVVFYLFARTLLHRTSSPKLHQLARLFPRYSPQSILFLLFLMGVALVLFGFGYYFTISSLITLSPENLLLLVGYFVFSLLVGFLSFITPTGLGVREGVVALGLAKFMASPLAAACALFARVILILSEIIFLGIAYGLASVKQRHIVNEIAFVMRNHYEAVLVLLFGIFSFYFSVVSFLRYDQYYTGRFDLGNMAQTVWNTMHGRVFEFTNPDGVNIISRLAFHADFILILFAPLYFIWESPKVLLLLQTLIVGGGTFFIYALAKDILKNKPLALTLSFLYLINPSLERATIYDFHAVTLATTFLLGAFYFVYQKKYWWFLGFAILAGIAKEQIWAVIALFGIYILFIQKNLRMGIAVFLIGALSFYFLIWHVIPQTAGGTGGHFALSYYTDSSGSELSESPTGLLKTYLLSPTKTLELVTDKERLNYLHQLLLPLGYLPLFAPIYLIFSLPDLGINLLSSRPQLYQIYYQYTAAITPFLFIATIFAIAFLRKRVKLLSPTFFIIYLLIVGLLTSYLYGPLPGGKSANLDMFTKPFPQKTIVDEITEKIPPDASVSASNGIGSHLAHRRYLYTLPLGWDTADYVIFNLNDKNAQPSLSDHKDLVQALRYNSEYILIHDDSVIVVFKKREKITF